MGSKSRFDSDVTFFKPLSKWRALEPRQTLPYRHVLYLVAEPVLKFRPWVAVVHCNLLPLNHQLFLQKKWFQLFLYRDTHVHFPMAEHPSEESVLLN